VYSADGVFVLREAVSPGQLVPGLETEGAHVRVNRKMETNLPGVFACGDITGTPYQYVKAAGEGNVAAISAAGYLEQKKRGGQNHGEKD
jgi:thioredoxin reductase (NADPH)